MKKLFVGIFVFAGLAAPALSASRALIPAGFIDTQIISHSGGCRKSSPPGQCCHAGSKPLHCH